eukprot:14580860-Alexandrium_andersonii.AAC.1
MAFKPPRRAAQWGVGISAYLARSDQNGPLACPKGLRSEGLEYRQTSHTAIRMALRPPTGAAQWG